MHFIYVLKFLNHFYKASLKGNFFRDSFVVQVYELEYLLFCFGIRSQTCNHIKISKRQLRLFDILLQQLLTF